MDFADKLKLRERYSHVRENEHDMQLIDYMTENFNRFDRMQWLEKINNQQLFVNGKIAAADTILKKHDRVSLFEELQDEPHTNISFKTIYEDEHLIIFDKSANLCVHPTGPFYQNTLWYQAGKKYGELFFVGRLDRETSGLIIAGRSKKIAALMQTDNFKIHKEYQVLVHGKFDKPLKASGFLVKDSTSLIAKKRRFTFDFCPDGESADTELFPLEIYADKFSLVRAIIHTGRMHQIRATMFSLGFPVVGDKLYGIDEKLYNKISTQSFSEEDRKKLILDNQALHCSVLSFHHPVTNKIINAESSASRFAEVKRR
ncbi:MAG: RluA family pseudouridine synthase [Lentisphaeria bacterium]|nr:RluA family pseudouridine synthase [Lentisphaeria bacterium]